MATAETPEQSGTFPPSHLAAVAGAPSLSDPPGALDEAGIVARAQDGDLSAFEYLVDTYQGRLFRLAYRMLNDRGDAEDVVQDTLTAGWLALPGLDRAGAFGGWIYRTATNRSLDILRRRSTRPAAELDPGGLWPALAAQSSDPHRNAEIAAELECLSRALAELPPGQRACWLLRELHDQSYAEIGAALGISAVTVRGRLARARENLAEAMIQWH